MPKKIISEKCKFYFVWTKSGHVPRYTHHTKKSAQAEAQRLAKLNPGKKYIVLEAIDKYHAVEPETKEAAQVRTDIALAA